MLLIDVKMMVQLNSLSGQYRLLSILTFLGGVCVAEMVRVNTRIGYDANAWLDAESERTGVPKSTLIHLAVEQYIQQKEVMASMSNVGAVNELLARLEELESKIESLSVMK